VVDELLEGAIPHATNRLPIPAGEMTHGSPAVHLIAVAGGDGRRTCKQRSKSKVLHGGENDLVRREEEDSLSRTTAATCLIYLSTPEASMLAAALLSRLKNKQWSR
jgi:hypothetical protein